MVVKVGIVLLVIYLIMYEVAKYTYFCLKGCSCDGFPQKQLFCKFKIRLR